MLTDFSLSKELREEAKKKYLKRIKYLPTVKEYNFFKEFAFRVKIVINESPDYTNEYDVKRLYEFVSMYWAVLVRISKNVQIDIDKHKNTLIQICKERQSLYEPYKIKDISLMNNEEMINLLEHINEQQDKIKAREEAQEDINDVEVIIHTLLYGEIEKAHTKEDFIEISNISNTDYAFLKDGDYWIVKYDDEMKYIKDSTGMDYIHRLLERPNKHFSCMELTSNCQQTPIIKTSKIIDSEAIENYKRKLTEIDSDLEEENNFYIIKELKSEREKIVQEIKENTFIGKSKKFDNELEKARKSVTIAISRALDNINSESPELYKHLKRSIQTGRSLIYQPDIDIPWKL